MLEEKYVSVSWGGGTNSTALLIGMLERNLRADKILFADTGGERPETYQYLDLFDSWLRRSGFPAITIVKESDRTGRNLEEDCLERKSLPSIAFGWKTCSQRYKLRPQERYLKELPEVQALWADGHQVVKYIGYDADEPQRAKPFSDKRYRNRYPLLEWDWGREECIAAIARAGLPQPGKSACFFCPQSKKKDILFLQDQHPELLQRALRMEALAAPGLTGIKGLGRRFSWREFIAQQTQTSAVADKIRACSLEEESDTDSEAPCGCYDGS